HARKGTNLRLPLFRALVFCSFMTALRSHRPRGSDSCREASARDGSSPRRPMEWRGQQTGSLGRDGGIWTESKKLGAKTRRTWKTQPGRKDASRCSGTNSGFPCFPLATCKLAKLSFVAGAELPKRYVVA